MSTAVNYGLITVNKGDAVELPRKGYHIDGECRPAHRGRLFSMVYHSNLWLIISAFYLAAKCDPTMTLFELGIRLTMIASVQYGFKCSDWLHCSDLYDADASKSLEEQRQHELTGLKYDMLCISLILASSCIMWAHKLFFFENLDILAGFNAGGVVLLAFVLWGMMKPHTLKDEYMPHYRFYLKLAQFILACQYFSMLQLVVAARNLDEQWAHLRNAGLIWFVYFPGMFCFVLKPFFPSTKTTIWGPHEVFHFFTFAGHLATMILDVSL